MNSIAQSSVERNAYDPIQVQWPSPWYWFKSGAAAMLGVCLMAGVGWFLFWIGWLSIAATIGALAHR